MSKKQHPMGFTIFFESDSDDDKQPSSGKKAAKSLSSKSESSRQITSADNIKSPSPPTVGPKNINDIISYGRQWTGHPYLDLDLQNQLGEVGAIKAQAARTGNSLRAIDCSGFAQELLGYAGVDPPGDQTAEGLYNHFRKGSGRQLKAPEKGSIIFFEPNEKPSSGPQAGRKITHVAFGIGGGRIIESRGGTGVGERSLPTSGYKYHIFMPNYKFNR